MEHNTDRNQNLRDALPVGAVLKELASSTRDLLNSKVELARAEFKSAAERVGRYAMLVGVFAMVALLSVPPFLAFLVIGLGNLLDGRFWLSSLIVAVVFAGVGVPFAMYYAKKLEAQNVDLPKTRRSLNRDMDNVADSVEDIKDSVTGKTNKNWSQA